MYVLLSPATGAGITAQTGTPRAPGHVGYCCGCVPARCSAGDLVGCFSFSAPTAEQLQDPTFIPRITRADRVSAANLPAYVREVERQAADSAQTRFPRWIWADTRHVDPLLLRRGVRVHLCHDLRLVQRILATAATHPSGFVEYSPVLDLSDVREAVEPQGYLPVARQIQGQEELFGADFLSAPAAPDSSTPPTSTAQSPTASSPDFLEAAPHEPFAPQLAAGPVTLLPEHPVVRVLMREWLAQARAISESEAPGAVASFWRRLSLPVRWWRLRLVITASRLMCRRIMSICASCWVRDRYLGSVRRRCRSWRSRFSACCLCRR